MMRHITALGLGVIVAAVISASVVPALAVVDSEVGAAAPMAPTALGRTAETGQASVPMPPAEIPPTTRLRSAAPAATGAAARREAPSAAKGEMEEPAAMPPRPRGRMSPPEARRMTMRPRSEARGEMEGTAG